MNVECHKYKQYLYDGALTRRPGNCEAFCIDNNFLDGVHMRVRTAIDYIGRENVELLTGFYVDYAAVLSDTRNFYCFCCTDGIVNPPAQTSEEYDQAPYNFDEDTFINNSDFDPNFSSESDVDDNAFYSDDGEFGDDDSDDR